MPTALRLHVSETFVSVQGEGPSTGTPAAFLRLAACNLACSWCDTPYTWKWSDFDRSAEVRTADAKTIADQLIVAVGDNVRLLVVTGGEPLLQQPALVLALRRIRKSRPGLRFEVETNGTIQPSPELIELISLFVVSPKLANSDLKPEKRIRESVLRTFSETVAVLKFVVSEADEMDEVAAIAALALFPPNRTWIMPEGTDPETIVRRMRALTPAVIHRGFNLSSRLQVILWGDTRNT